MTIQIMQDHLKIAQEQIEEAAEIRKVELDLLDHKLARMQAVLMGDQTVDNSRVRHDPDEATLLERIESENV